MRVWSAFIEVVNMENEEKANVLIVICSLVCAGGLGLFQYFFYIYFTRTLPEQGRVLWAYYDSCRGASICGQIYKNLYQTPLLRANENDDICLSLSSYSTLGYAIISARTEWTPTHACFSAQTVAALPVN